MRELEETGLSREELLYDGRVVWNFSKNLFKSLLGWYSLGLRPLLPILEKEPSCQRNVV